MLKKLTQIGTSWGVIIPKATLEFLKINPVMDKIEFIVTENEIKIRKAKR